MKIRRLFGLNASIGQNKSKFVATSVPIYYQKNREIVDENFGINSFEDDKIVGSIFNFRYVSKKKWWLELTTGVEKESVKYTGTKNFNNSRIGLDDIILSGGYNFVPNKKIQFVIYGLAGFPSKRKLTELEINNFLVGTRFFSLGLGSEFSFSFFDSLERSLIGSWQVRFLHFFDRSFEPILENSIIQPGNTTDLLFALQYRKLKNLFEVGYNPTFFTNQAIILPKQTIIDDNFIRNGFYITYSRLFPSVPLIKLPGLIGAGYSYSQSDFLNTKIQAFWLNFSIVF